MLMTDITTLRHYLEYVGTTLPNALLKATFYALDLGAVETIRDGVSYPHMLQELVACKPELLDRSASLVVYDAGQEKGGIISLEEDKQVLFLFHSNIGDGLQAIHISDEILKQNEIFAQFQ
ncbi:MAG TPA: hypothetical protein VL485_17855 [Ktedonobacteraceae bacterium]|nr:hypothetical protein [Ktedonobacteraceae bacterium]